MSNEEENDRLEINIQVFVYNDQEGKFEELILDEDRPLYDLLNSDDIFLFIDHNHSIAWTWIGSNTTPKMKFISAKIAPSFRDRYGFAYRLKTQDEGSEPTAFKIMIGLEKEIKEIENKVEPRYIGTPEDRELLKELSLQKIIQLLEKVDIPEGYERIMVIVNKEIYRYKEIEKNYPGAVIKEKKLFLLKEQVPDGPYLAENYVPRILFSFNKVIIVELLEKKEMDKN